MFEEHDLVRASATECMCNLVLSTEVESTLLTIDDVAKIYRKMKLKVMGILLCSQVQKLYLATGNDRLKLLVLYSGEEDERLRRAAAGTLAMLTAEQPELCARIPTTVSTDCPHICIDRTFQTNYYYINVFCFHSHHSIFSDDPLARDHTSTAAQ